jgi:phage-related baseplate assembly protein
VILLRAGADPTPTLSEREAVRMSLIANDVRPLTDMVEVLGPKVHPVTITARLTLYSGPDGNLVRNRALKALRDWVEANRMLGMNLRRSAIFAKLHQEGVHSVELISPVDDLVLGPTDVYAIDAVTITVAALRDA